jgi:5'-nucleotidase
VTVVDRDISPGNENGTDRRAVVNGKISVSPLTAPHTVEHHEHLDDLVATYDA